MSDFFSDPEGMGHFQDPTAAEACPFVAPPNSDEEHARRKIAGQAAQQLFDGKNPYDASFDAEVQLRNKYPRMLDESPVRGRYLVDRTLRRIFFAVRGHIMDIHLFEYLNNSIAQDKPLSEDDWPDDPNFYRSTTVEPYHGSNDRFMRTIVGMNDLASAQAQPRLSDRFMDAFRTAYGRYFTSLVEYKEAYPKEDVPEVDRDPEVNWRLGLRVSGDNVAAVQIAHALAYYRQHPDASVEDIWRSSLTSSTVLSTAARIRRQTFNKLGLKAIPADFDAWETKGAKGFLDHPSLFVYDDSGLAIPVNQSLTEASDSYCSSNLNVKRTDPYERRQVETFSAWMRENSNWPGVDDGQGGFLHKKGVFQEANLQIAIGSCIGRTTIFPALLQTIKDRRITL